MASVHVHVGARVCVCVIRDFLLKAKHQAYNQSHTGPKMKTQSNAHMRVHAHSCARILAHKHARSLTRTQSCMLPFALRVEPRMLLLLSQQLQDCDRLWPATRTNGSQKASPAH